MSEEARTTESARAEAPAEAKDDTLAAAQAEAQSAVQADAEAQLGSFTTDVSDQVESFMVAIEEIAAGEAPNSAISMLLLEVSQLLLAGGRLGAIADVLPDERYEPDIGPDPDADDIRERLAVLLEPIDVYTEVFDPYSPGAGTVTLRLSDDLASVVADLRHGLLHYRAGRELEALWWWQFSYLSSWGATATAALRALQSLVSHVRLDSPLGAVPDGQDTDSIDDEALEAEAGAVMQQELADLVDDQV